MKKEDVALAMLRKQLIKSGLSPEMVDQCLMAAKAMSSPPPAPPLAPSADSKD